MRVLLGALFCAAMLVIVAQTLNSGPAAQGSPWGTDAALPGWRLDLQSRGSRVSVATLELGFVLGEGESLHPTIAAASLSACYRGWIRLADESNAVRFHFVAEGGSVQLQCRGAEGLLWESPQSRGEGVFEIVLPGTDLELSVIFVRSDNQPARLQLLWEKPGEFELEPISPRDVVTREVAAMTRREHSRQGRALLEEYRCTRCHAAENEWAWGVEERAAPHLGWVAATLRPDGVRHTMANPRRHSAHSRMPDVMSHLGDAERQEAIESLVAFLWSRVPPLDSGSVANEPRVLAEGRRLYHQVGCVPCHGAVESPAVVYATESLPHEVPPLSAKQVALVDLGDHWTPAGLSRFLRDPMQFRPFGGMPSLLLSEEESDFIANYLLDRQPATVESTPPTISRERIEAGAQLFSELGCANCHSLGHGLPEVAKQEYPPLAALDSSGGCLSDESGAWPRFSFAPDEVRLLKGALSELHDVCSPSPRDELQRQFQRFRCSNCHSCDGSQRPDAALDVYFAGDEDVELGDEGRIPPDLSYVGFKLKDSWLRGVLFDKQRARPYMTTRMPHYLPGAADFTNPQRSHPLGLLAKRLSNGSGVVDHLDDDSAQEQALAGRSVAGDQGLNCISCHVFGDLPAAGIPGPDLRGFGERLRYPWWVAYARSPHRLKPGTRMPAFFADEKTSALEILDGDSRAQIDALWSYFQLGDKMPVPSGVTSGAELQLLVGERPRVFRGFLGDAGARAIAVGYPIGLHFAFDAEACQLVDAWNGDFLNAAGSWSGRGGQNLGGQGETVWKAPENWGIRLQLDSNLPWRFNGYHFNTDGIPVFRYSSDAIIVEERFSPDATADVLFTRQFDLTLVAATPRLWVRSGGGELHCIAGCQVTMVRDGWSELQIDSAGTAISFELKVKS